MINLLILNGPKWGWVLKGTLLPFYPREIKLFSNLQEAGLPRGDLVGGENLAFTKACNPKLPSRSE